MPALRAQLSGAEQFEAVRFASDGLAAARRGCTALYQAVDGLDNADMRAYVAGLLQSGGYAVIEVSDGAEGLAAARQHSPDLVLADVMMPRLDGFGLLRLLRADARLSGVPFILLSARAADMPFWAATTSTVAAIR